MAVATDAVNSKSGDVGSNPTSASRFSPARLFISIAVGPDCILSQFNKRKMFLCDFETELQVVFPIPGLRGT